jgi:hypothetical protein
MSLGCGSIMSSTTTTTVAAVSTHVTGSSIETITIDGSPGSQSEDDTKGQDQRDFEPDDAYLPANHGATGREVDMNPPSWPRDHRRMPPYRQPVRHLEWDAIGGPAPMRIFMWDMFSGCQLLQVGRMSGPKPFKADS